MRPHNGQRSDMRPRLGGLRTTTQSRPGLRHRLRDRGSSAFARSVARWGPPLIHPARLPLVAFEAASMTCRRLSVASANAR